MIQLTSTQAAQLIFWAHVNGQCPPLVAFCAAWGVPSDMRSDVIAEMRATLLSNFSLAPGADLERAVFTLRDSGPALDFISDAIPALYEAHVTLTALGYTPNAGYAPYLKTNLTGSWIAYDAPAPGTERHNPHHPTRVALTLDAGLFALRDKSGHVLMPGKPLALAALLPQAPARPRPAPLPASPDGEHLPDRNELLARLLNLLDAPGAPGDTSTSDRFRIGARLDTLLDNLGDTIADLIQVRRYEGATGTARAERTLLEGRLLADLNAAFALAFALGVLDASQPPLALDGADADLYADIDADGDDPRRAYDLNDDAAVPDETNT